MDQSNRLTSSGITIRDLIKSCYYVYRKSGMDNKDKRARLDIVSGKLIRRQNYTYNNRTKEFEQTGRDVKFEFMVKSDPVSYKRNDSIKIHTYPITFLIHNIDKGLDSTFKFRSGSLKKPLFSKVKGDSKLIAEKNIRNGVELSFFFSSMFVFKKFNILYGKNWANRPPLKTNPKQEIFLSKHGWFILSRILVRLLTDKKNLVSDSKNEMKN